MPHKPVSTKKFKRYLKSLGLKKKRMEGDHEIWDRTIGAALARPVVFIACDKEIPAFHIDTNLDTLGVDPEDFWEWLKCN